jgi:hypothetical protein
MLAPERPLIFVPATCFATLTTFSPNPYAILKAHTYTSIRDNTPGGLGISPSPQGSTPVFEPHAAGHKYCVFVEERG